MANICFQERLPLRIPWQIRRSRGHKTWREDFAFGVYWLAKPRSGGSRMNGCALEPPAVTPMKLKQNAMKITDAFIAEHAVIHSQLDHLEEAIPAAKTLGEVKVMAALLDAALRPHAEAEDELLFNGLEPGLDQMGKLEKVKHEHDAICKGLDQVRSARSRKDAQRRLLAIVRLTRKEFDLEDRLLFRMAEELLREETLLKLGRSWARKRIAPSR